MQTKVFKKTLFGGFDRADVMQYINELQKESTAKLKKANAKCDELEQNNTELQQSIKELRERVDGLDSKCEDLESQNKALSDVNAELTDEISHQVGKIFTQARINAQSIVSEARIKAEHIERSSAVIRDAAQEGLNTTKTSIKDAKDEISVILDEVIEKLGIIFDSLENPKVFEQPVNNEDDMKKIPVKISRRSPIRKVD